MPDDTVRFAIRSRQDITTFKIMSRKLPRAEGKELASDRMDRNARPATADERISVCRSTRNALAPGHCRHDRGIKISRAKQPAAALCEQGMAERRGRNVTPVSRARITKSVSEIRKMADREGFEPSRRSYRLHAFQACAFDHSATCPCCKDTDRALDGGATIAIRKADARGLFARRGRTDARARAGCEGSGLGIGFTLENAQPSAGADQGAD